MRRKGIAIIALLAVLVWGGVSYVDAEPPKKSPDFSGEWKCEGWNMGSDFKKKADYELKVVLESKGKDTYLVKWKLNSGRDNVGVGIYDPRTKVFAAGYTVGRMRSPGVAIYEIDDKKVKSMTCVGTFEGRIGDVAQERWTRK